MIPLFLTAGPNEVLVVSGVGYDKPIMINGGRIIVVPGFHTWQRMSLNVMCLEITSSGVYTREGVPLKVAGVAQVKVASSPPELLALACEHFLSKHEEQIKHLIKETLEGHQRGIMGTMTVEEIYKNRKLFNQRVFEVASKDLLNFGVTVLSYTINHLEDDQGYLKVLGMGRTAEVMRDARIGEAHSRMEAHIREAEANEELSAHQLSNRTKVALAERTFLLNKAKYDKEVSAEKAIADFAYKLQEAVTKQQIKEEEMQTRVVERAKLIEVQEEELKRKKVALEGTVKKPAEYEKARLEIIAEANRKKTVLEAEAKAEAIRIKSEAEQQAILAMAKAESEQMAMKAEAWEEFGKAALLEQYLKTIPQIANRISGPMSNVKTIKMVSSNSSEVGAEKITSEIAAITASIPALVEQLTGVKLGKQLDSLKQPVRAHH